MHQFQSAVGRWVTTCFGADQVVQARHRAYRYGEESNELLQAVGVTRDEAHQLVDYVYGRPVGEQPQEVGGVMLTLAALCNALGLDMAHCGRSALDEAWVRIEAIRAKERLKPAIGPLPGRS
jgi:hypothetical protein